MAQHLSLPVASVFLFVKWGCSAWTLLGSGTLEDMVVLGSALSSHAGCSRWLHAPPPRYSLLTVSLIWHLEVLGDKQCYLSEDHGKSRMGGASRWVYPIGRVAHGPHCLIREALAEPGTWTQADGSLGRINPFAFDQWGCGSFQSSHVLLLG